MEGSVHQYFVPKMLKEYAKADLGFRAAIGYEFRNFRFAVESDYNGIIGTNPLVLDIKFIPLVFKFGYHWQIIKILGLQADIGVGLIFSETTHYETAIDWAMGNLITDNERSF